MLTKIWAEQNQHSVSESAKILKNFKKWLKMAVFSTFKQSAFCEKYTKKNQFFGNFAYGQGGMAVL